VAGLVLLSVGSLGLSCVATQLVLMREMLGVFAGNELVLGVVLGNWLLLMGTGAWLGRWPGRGRDRLGILVRAQLAVALLPLLQLLAVRVLPVYVFPRGATVGLQATLLGSLVILLPYCLLAGATLTVACALLAEDTDQATGAGRVYVADSLGSIVGGAAISLVLIWALDSFALLTAVAVLALGPCAALAWRAGRSAPLVAALALSLGLPLAVVILKPDHRLTRLQYPGQEVLFCGNSPYGRLVVTRAAGQLTFFQNGVPSLTSHSVERVEEAVHYAMAQRPEAEQVLLIGGGVAGTAKELLKYPSRVTYAELDPLFLAVGRRLLPEHLDDRRVQVVNTDGRRFVQTTTGRFDVVILDLPDPLTAQLNRFYTAEFFAEAKRIQSANGVLAAGLGRYENFISPELASLLATTHHTLRSVFTNVTMLPGGRVFFLASDGDLHPDIAARLERAGIPTRFVNRHYLQGMMTSDRRAAVERAVSVETPVNRDFNPVLYFQCVQHWASQFPTPPGLLGIALGVALLVFVCRLRGGPAAVFAGGFAASSLEVVLLLGFQALCGSLYYQLGILVTVFMAGLAVGAAWANRRKAIRAAESAPARLPEPATVSSGQDHASPQRMAKLVGLSALRAPSDRHVLALLALAVAAFAVLLPLALGLLSTSPRPGGSSAAVPAVIACLTFTLAALVGAEFPVANRAVGASAGVAASGVYAVDFVGASLGALLASAWLIPVLGMARMCWLAAGLNLVAAALVVLPRGRTTAEGVR